MEYLDNLKQIAKQNHIPIIKDDGCDFLIEFCKQHNFKNILEIGTAVGYSGSLMLKNTTESYLTTIEINQQSFDMATQTFKQYNLTNRVTQILGDAKDEIKKLNQKYDFIFLDGPKGQYLNYYQTLKTLLTNGGYILADNIYLHGLVFGPEFVKHKHRSMVVNLRKFIKFVQEDPEVSCQILDVGDGIMIIQKTQN